jgi:hypothetical protein
MIQTTSNAAASIARRNAILAGIPKAVWNPAMRRRGRSSPATRRDAVEHARQGHRRVHELRPRAGGSVLCWSAPRRVDDVGLEDVADLRAMFRQLKNKETTVEELMRQANSTGAEPKAVTHGNPMADEGPGPQKGGAPAQEPAKAEETAPAAEKAPEAEKPAEDKPAARKRATKPKEETAPAAEEATAPAAEEAKAEPTAESDPLPVTDPKNEGEYVRYAIGWLHQLGSASEITERWKNERRLRNECGVTSETLEELTAEREKRIAAL